MRGIEREAAQIVGAKFSRIYTPQDKIQKAVGAYLVAEVTFRYKGPDLRVKVYWMMAPGDPDPLHGVHGERAVQIAAEDANLVYTPDRITFGPYRLWGTFPDIQPDLITVFGVPLTYYNAFDCMIGIQRLDTGEVMDDGWWHDVYTRTDWREPIGAEFTDLDAKFS